MLEVMRECEREWAREASMEAEEGNVAAMVRYADMLSVGYGLQKNLRLAKWWYNMAIERGSKEASKRLQKMERQTYSHDNAEVSFILEDNDTDSTRAASVSSD